MTDAKNIVQAGTIVAFAGDVTDSKTLESLENSGWLVCDGKAYSNEKYPLLALSISTDFGGFRGPRGKFNVPDLRGRFLRGRSADSGHDPDADKRKAINPGGRTGNSIGSLQLSATARPKKRFNFESNGEHSHTIGNVPQGSNAYALAGSHYALANSGGVASASSGVHVHSLENWDHESRPTNLYVNYLINTGTGSSNTEITPLLGAIAAFGFQLQSEEEPAAPWLFCNGGSKSTSKFPELYKVIGTTWEKNSVEKEFTLPNMLGMFIKGASASSNILASFESDATALPQNSKFQAALSEKHSHEVPHVPKNTSYYDIAGSHYGWDEGTQTSDKAGNHTHQCGAANSEGSGGDAETRPVNVYVDFGILGDVGTGPVTDTFPVGTILMYGSDVSDDTLQKSNFVYCDGRPLSRTEYPELFKVIGTSFGKGAHKDKFSLPNLTGVFPRGVNGSASGEGYDPDANERIAQPDVVDGNTGNKVGSYQTAATGEPQNPMYTTENGSHTHQFPNVPNDNSSSAIAGSGQSIWTDDSSPSSSDGAHVHQIANGGDDETRPSSVSCYYVIKYK